MTYEKCMREGSVGEDIIDNLGDAGKYSICRHSVVAYL